MTRGFVRLLTRGFLFGARRILEQIDAVRNHRDTLGLDSVFDQPVLHAFMFHNGAIDPTLEAKMVCRMTHGIKQEIHYGNSGKHVFELWQ